MYGTGGHCSFLAFVLGLGDKDIDGQKISLPTFTLKLVLFININNTINTCKYYDYYSQVNISIV